MARHAGEQRHESQALPDFPFARYAELLGLTGIKVDAPEQVGPAWDEALAADGPVVIEAWVNADVPTVPPSLTKKQADQLTHALDADDPDAEGVRAHLAGQGLQEEAGV